MTAEPPSAAARLCSACGMCCNGVLFHTVRLQAPDTPQAMVALGLRVKHKNKGDFVQQPCPAYRESCCAIYEARPQRCRLFECRQLQRLAAGESDENEAFAKIHEAQTRLSHVRELFQKAGETNSRGPLTKRYERLIAEPVDARHDPDGVLLRGELAQAMQELEDLLERDFRVK